MSGMSLKGEEVKIKEKHGRQREERCGVYSGKWGQDGSDPILALDQSLVIKCSDINTT